MSSNRSIERYALALSVLISLRLISEWQYGNNRQPDEKEHASSVIQDSCAGAFTGFHNNDRDFLPSVYGEIQANVVSEGKQLLHGR